MTAQAVTTRKLTIDWGKTPAPRPIWMASWVVSREGEEGDYFYDGEGEAATTHDVPAGVIGFRLRAWPPETEDAGTRRQPTLSQPYFFDAPQEHVQVSAQNVMPTVRK